MILTSPNNAFQDCASLEIIDCSKIVPTGNISNMFHGCSSLKSLDLSSWASQSSTFTNVNGLFRYCGELKTLNLSGWDLSHLTAIYDWFDGNNSLENVILDNTTLFSATFKVNGCPNLTVESLSAIFNALPTLAEGVTKTLTLHANHKILQSQVDSANAKGWTVAGGTVVKEEEYNG
jgi:surface protein